MLAAVFFLFFLIFGMIILMSWFVVANDCTFDCNAKLYPGKEYTVNGKTYKVPDLPHKLLGTEQKASRDRPIPKLPDQYLKDLKQLAEKSFQLFRDANVPFWVTGGTLFSAYVWKHFMPFDDDIDVSVPWEDREYVWGQNFAKMASLAGLEAISLRGSSLTLATREGSGIRLRMKNTYVPVLDIFFTKRIDQKYCKIDSWMGDTAYPNKREIWEPDWLYPLQKVELDGLVWSLPNQPEKLLRQQYGPNCLDSIQSPDPLVKTHFWVTYFTNYVGAWKVQPISDETNVETLKNPRVLVSN